jgi:hypothetical protein
VISYRPFIGHRRGNRLIALLSALLALRNFVPLGAVWLALLALLAGCGSSGNGIASKSAGEILTAARAAAQSAHSVRITTKSSARGTTLTLNAGLAKDHGRGRYSLLGLEVEAILIGDTLYVKGNRLFNARLEDTMGIAVPSGLWLKGPTSSRFGRMGAIIDMKRELPLILGGSGPVAKGATVNIDGMRAIAIKEATKTYTGTLYVAATGKPYPLKLVKTGQETGQTTFTKWNEPITVTPPANAIAISSLQRTKKNGH